MSWIPVLVLLCAQESASSQPSYAVPPSALRKLFDAASATRLQTGQLDYVIQENLKSDESSGAQFFSSTFAGPDVAVTRRGDQDGVVFKGPDGRPSDLQTYQGPWSFLIKDGVVWDHVERSVHARTSPLDTAETFWAIDVRNLVRNPLSFQDGLEEMVRTLSHEGRKPLRFSEEVKGGVHVVTMTTVDQGSLRWHIDSGKDWNCELIERLSPAGAVLSETRVQLEIVDGHWFPLTVEFGCAPNGKATRTIEITHAEFNRPEHARELHPGDIGIEAGVSVTAQSPGLPDGRWDGEKVISYEEYQRRLSAGELSPGPTYQSEIRRLRAARRSSSSSQAATATQPTTQSRSATQPVALTPWETFTQQFIEIYQLDDPQTQKAWLICADAQEQSKPVLKWVESELAELAKKRQVIENSETAGRDDQLRESDRKRRALTASVDELFERDLRHRLFKLPTRTQLEAGKKSPRAVGPLQPPTP